MANVKLLRPRRVKLLATVHKLNVNLFLDLNYLCVSICVWVNRKIGPNRMQTLQNRQKSQNQHHFVTELMYNTVQFNIHVSFHSSIYVVGNQDGPSPPSQGHPPSAEIVPCLTPNCMVGYLRQASRAVAVYARGRPGETKHRKRRKSIILLPKINFNVEDRKMWLWGIREWLDSSRALFDSNVSEPKVPQLWDIIDMLSYHYCYHFIRLKCVWKQCCVYTVFAHVDYFICISKVKEPQLSTCLAALGRFDGYARSLYGTLKM